MTKPDSRTLTPLLLLPIIILMFLGSLMLYRLYRTKTISEIHEERRVLDSEVIRTYFREYQSIFLVIHSVRQITAGSEEELKISIQSLLDLYGPEGRLPGIIREIGFQEAGDPDSLVILDGERNWIRKNFSSEEFITEELSPELQKLEPGEAVLFSQNTETTGERSSYLNYLLPGPAAYQIRLELDWRNFEELYVKPAVVQALSGYILEWTENEVNASREDKFADPDPELKEFRFSPFLVLLNRPYKEKVDHILGLPSPMQGRKPVIIGKDVIPADNDEEMPRDFLFRMDRDIFREPARQLRIGRESAPYYEEIERANALAWLQGMIFLYGIGILFLIIVAQLARLRNLREKEQEFVASITHELRTPLTVLQSAADNLALGIIPPEKISRYGSVIKDQVLRLATMIEEILLFSSIEGKAVHSDPVLVDLRQLVQEVRVSMEAMAGKQGIGLKWDMEGLPPAGLSDPDIIRLGLNNLIMNALNHAYPDSSGPVRVRIRTGIPGSLLITVEDEGRGIVSTEQRKVFSPFYRDRFSRQNQEKGSGLGLYITAKKASAAGGSLKLESPYRKINGLKQTGCRFTLRIACKMVHEEV